MFILICKMSTRRNLYSVQIFSCSPFYNRLSNPLVKWNFQCPEEGGLYKELIQKVVFVTFLWKYFLNKVGSIFVCERVIIILRWISVSPNWNCNFVEIERYLLCVIKYDMGVSTITCWRRYLKISNLFKPE